MNAEVVRETLNKAVTKLNPTDAWPVNLHGILSRLGIKLRFEAVEGKGASYLLLYETPTIVINRQNPAPLLSAKERFSIAHELAHWVVWRRFGSVPASQNEYWWHEIACNDFAAKLLVSPRTLEHFLERRVNEKIHHIHFPREVARAADVSWEVAAKSIAATSSADSAYLRFVKLPSKELQGQAAASTRRIAFKTNCSTVAKSPGSFVGRNAVLRADEELFKWLDDLPQKTAKSRRATFSSGNLHLTNVPCTFLRESLFWIVHLRPSSQGIQVESQPQAKSRREQS